jgi:hypothetical protein
MLEFRFTFLLQIHAPTPKPQKFLQRAVLTDPKSKQMVLLVKIRSHQSQRVSRDEDGSESGLLPT